MSILSSVPVGPGDTLARYRLESLIGHGGAGVVFRAHDPLPSPRGRAVAIKVLSPMLARTADAVSRFKAEARLCTYLDHESVVKVFDYGQDRELFFLAMELLEGETLRDRLKDQALLHQAQTVLLGMHQASALRAAHRRGIVHRDLKPANIFVLRGEPMRTKLLDFGVAYLAFRSMRTASVHRLGSFRYMAPEQFQGATRAQSSSDIYSLGCVLYEALSGQPAFPQTDDGELLRAVARAQVRPLRNIAPEAHPELCRVIQACLDRDPILRPTAELLLRELTSLLELVPPTFACSRPKEPTFLCDAETWSSD